MIGGDDDDDGVLDGIVRARNIISGNAVNGIRIATGLRTRIEGNFIGVAADGTTALGNGENGVVFEGDSINNNVGGTAAARAM